MQQNTFILLMMSLLLVQCGRESDHASEVSAEKTWYGYCLNPSTGKLFTENGRTVQKFLCGKNRQDVQANAFSPAQQKAQAACKRAYGTGVRLGNVGNLGPGVAGGDVTTDLERVYQWFEANCYGFIDP